MSPESLKNLLPSRPENIHKGDRGRLLIAGGSAKYPGAPALSALGALRSGVGLVTLLSLEKVCECCASRLPEVIYCFEDDKFRWQEIVFSQKNINALVVGPGLDRSVAAEIFTARMWRDWPEKILVDGDGLSALAVVREKIMPRSDSVITPHEGEAARLLNITPRQVQKNRLESLQKLTQKFGCVVLKGHPTLIASGEDFAEVQHGGPELAVPGSGDVLSGCIGAFLAAGLDPFNAAVLGANIHAMAGDYLARDGVDGVLASEIADTLRRVINDLRRIS
ncbi:MAG: NAD(P)H-hydrate dehydratase [Synergistaceae bacterium]|nr:NAD(P)H-hydrate dehydratase [Synergistaceae bacterium]